MRLITIAISDSIPESKAKQGELLQYCEYYSFESIEQINVVMDGRTDIMVIMDNLLIRAHNKRDFEGLLIASPADISTAVDVFLYYVLQFGLRGIKLMAMDGSHQWINPKHGELFNFVIMTLLRNEEVIPYITADRPRGTTNRGRYESGRAPFGYKVVNARLAIDEHNADLVRRIMLMDDQGLSNDTIAGRLVGANKYRKNGDPMSPYAIGNIISGRRFYEGQYRLPHGGWVLGDHPPILLPRLTREDMADGE